MGQIHVSDHPLIKDKLALLRDKATRPLDFRALLHEITLLLCYEITRDIVIRPETVETPMGTTSGHRLGEKIGIVPILRAGLGMVDPMLRVLPVVQVWHIGLYRDEKTLKPVQYYNKLPPKPTVDMCIILDPMLATGGSAVATVNILKEWGVERIKFLGIIAAPEGIEELSSSHPDVDIYVAARDEKLNDIGFIVPGLGDAGDRQFGT